MSAHINFLTVEIHVCSNEWIALGIITPVSVVISVVLGVLAIYFYMRMKIGTKIRPTSPIPPAAPMATEFKTEHKSTEDKAKEFQPIFQKTYLSITNAGDDTSQSDSGSVDQHQAATCPKDTLQAYDKSPGGELRSQFPRTTADRYRPRVETADSGLQMDEEPQEPRTYASKKWIEETDKILSSIRSRKKKSELTYNLMSVLEEERLFKLETAV